MCDELERYLEQDPDGPLPEFVAAHVATCADCQALKADFRQIGAAALELAQEEVAPPEWLWARIRTQLESEGRIRESGAARAPISADWWSVFQRPAFAGAVLAVALVAAGLVSFSSVSTTRTDTQTSARLDLAPAPAVTAESQSTGSLDASEASIESLPERDPQVAEELHHDLGVVDNFIAVCEKSVREQPDNEMAREYLYDAYQQKAQLLAVAMDRRAVGGK
jgi:hypothetical protein